MSKKPKPEVIPWPTSSSSVLDDDNLLLQILRRLPPWPSSLPRASVVCKRWYDLITSSFFLRDFCAFHRAALPVLGFFHNTYLGAPDRRFVAAVDPPDRVPASLVRMPCGRNHRWWRFIDCRDGRAPLLGPRAPSGLRRVVLMWDPMTGAQRRALLPPDAWDVRHGAVLCFCSHERDCRSSPFQMVLVWWEQGAMQRRRAVAAVYSSESSAWSHTVSVQTSLATTARNAWKPGMLAGNAVYWLIPGSPIQGILEFDAVRRNLSLISVPENAAGSLYCQCLLVLTEAKELGFATVTEASIRLFKRDTANSAQWAMYRSIQLDGCLPSRKCMDELPSLLGFHEESNEIFLWTKAGVFMIQLESMRSRMLCQGRSDFEIYPFAGFYTRDGAAGAQANGATLEDTLRPTITVPLDSVPMWHYEDPQGNLHGPFTISNLRLWNRHGYFSDSFRVWRTDETKEQTALLTDTIR